MAKTIAAWLLERLKNEYAVVFLVSLIPTIEVKGAIPIGAQYDVNIWAVFGMSVASALIVCPIILLVLRPFITCLKRFKWFSSLGKATERLFLDKAAKSDKDLGQKLSTTAKLKKNLALFLFVALPAPLTGVWTGSAIAAFSKQKYRYSIIPIALGCIVQGLLFTAVTILGGQTAADILSYTALAFMVLSITALVIQLVIKNRKNKNAAKSECANDDLMGNDNQTGSESGDQET